MWYSNTTYITLLCILFLLNVLNLMIDRWDHSVYTRTSTMDETFKPFFFAISWSYMFHWYLRIYYVIIECCNASKCKQYVVDFGSNFVHLCTINFEMFKFVANMWTFVAKESNEMYLLDQNSFSMFQDHHGKV